jgi:predicted ABC-type ATPase
MISLLDRRPIVVALPGPNGAGKTTFYYSHLQPAGLRLVNPDLLAVALRMDPYKAAAFAGSVRDELLRQRESFVFETVFSAPLGDKLSFLRRATHAGYTVLLCFIGISGPQVSRQRVGMRVLQGGHDVPAAKLVSRYPRILKNLKAALRDLPHVWVFDNDDLSHPFRLAAVRESGRLVQLEKPVPAWLKRSLPQKP